MCPASSMGRRNQSGLQSEHLEASGWLTRIGKLLVDLNESHSLREALTAIMFIVWTGFHSIDLFLVPTAFL